MMEISKREGLQGVVVGGVLQMVLPLFVHFEPVAQSRFAQRSLGACESRGWGSAIQGEQFSVSNSGPPLAQAKHLRFCSKR